MEKQLEIIVKLREENSSLKLKIKSLEKIIDELQKSSIRKQTSKQPTITDRLNNLENMQNAFVAKLQRYAEELSKSLKDCEASNENKQRRSQTR